MAVNDFTLSHPKAEDRTFDPDLIFGIIRDRGTRVGCDHRRAQSFLKAAHLLEMAQDEPRDGTDDLISHLRALAAIDEAEPDPYQNVTLTACIDAAAKAGDDVVDDEVVCALLRPHGVSLAAPPRGSEASWRHETYVGIGRIPLRYAGLPLGLPAILVRRDDRTSKDDHVSVVWEAAQYLRIGDRRSLSIMATLPDTVTTDLIGAPLHRLIKIPGLEDATILDAAVGGEGGWIEMELDIEDHARSTSWRATT